MSEYTVTSRPQRGFDEISHLYQWLDSSEGMRGFIAGSYPTHMVQMREPSWNPGDIDIWMRSEDDFALFHEQSRDLGYLPADFNPIAWKYSPIPGQPFDIPLQIIKPNPNWDSIEDEVIASFDLSCSRAILLSPDVVSHDTGVIDTVGKVLLVNDPMKTLHRVYKYMHRGWTFSEFELMKIFKAYDAMSDFNRAMMYERYTLDTSPEPEDYGWYDDDDYFRGE